MTEKLYDKDAYLQIFEAQVLSCTKTDSGFETILDRTCFFPYEGGQDCDTGYIDDSRVLNVWGNSGDIIHLTDKPVCGKVQCRLDWQQRFDRMQQHTGEHIVCGIVHSRYGYENVGFHLGNDDVTFDFNGPLSAAELEQIEISANNAVMSNLAVSAYYPDAARLESLQYRSKKQIDGPVRIVEIENTDICACCAPHVSKTGEIGIIKFTDHQAYKGGVRIHMSCGMRALRDYQKKQNSLDIISNELSCTPYNADMFFEKYIQETARLKQTAGRLRRELILLRAQSIQKTDSDIILFEEDADTNTLRLTVNALDGKYGGICAVFAGNDSDGYIFAAASDVYDMNQVANMLRRQLSARCGGDKHMIQGSINAKKNKVENLFKNIT